MHWQGECHNEADMHLTGGSTSRYLTYFENGEILFKKKPPYLVKAPFFILKPYRFAPPTLGNTGLEKNVLYVNRGIGFWV